MLKSSNEGFTRCPNEILEALAAAKLTSVQFSIALYILRYTYGYRREKHKISTATIAKTVNKDRVWIIKQLKQLADYNIVIAIGGRGQAKEYKINDDVAQWKNKTYVAEDICRTKHKTYVAEDIGLMSCKTYHIKKKERNIKESSSNSKKIADENIKKAIQLYEQNIGVPGAMAIEILRDILSSHSTDLLELAIQEAVKANAKSINYIEAIFRNWDNAGVKTVESAKHAIAEHKNKKQVTADDKNKNDSIDNGGYYEI